jgi:hypothetical protein
VDPSNEATCTLVGNECVQDSDQVTEDTTPVISPPNAFDSIERIAALVRRIKPEA